MFYAIDKITGEIILSINSQKWACLFKNNKFKNAHRKIARKVIKAKITIFMLI